VSLLEEPQTTLHPFGPAVEAFDRTVDAAFERLREQPTIDRIFFTASALGDWSLVWHLIGATQALLSPDRIPDFLRLSGTLGVESLLVNQGVKRLFHRRRPQQHAVEGPVDLRVPLTSSFPSGHASAGFCAAVLLSQRQPKLAPVWLALATLIAASRIHVRLHHASDVVSGAAIGALFGWIATRVVPLD
jgi:membrane-associated phospholipid phosphatase